MSRAKNRSQARVVAPESSRGLGRWPSRFGQVVRGDGRGKELGFPTANLLPQNEVLPPHGVYAVEVLHDGEQFCGVANLGVRPTFSASGGGQGTADGATDSTTDDAGSVLEVHLLDQDLDMYGATIEVSFLAHLRGERRFASGDELKAQIQQDILRAREVFAS